MSVRVSGCPAVRQSRWLSATAGAISAFPVGYDHDTRLFVERYPDGNALLPSNTVTEFSNTRSPAGDHRNGPTLSRVSSVRQLVVPLAGLTVYSLVPTSNVTSELGGGGENTHAPLGSTIVLAGTAATAATVEAGSVVTVVGGTVLLGVPRGARVSGVLELWSTLQPAASTAMPIATHAKRFIARNGRSLVKGRRTKWAWWSVAVACGLAAGCSSAPAAAPSTAQSPTSPATTTTTLVRPSSTGSTSTTTAAPTTTTGPRPLALRLSVHGQEGQLRAPSCRLPGHRRVRLRCHRRRPDRRHDRSDAHVRPVGSEDQRPGDPWRQVRVAARRRRCSLLLRPPRQRRGAAGRRRRWRHPTRRHGPNRRRPEHGLPHSRRHLLAVWSRRMGGATRRGLAVEVPRRLAEGRAALAGRRGRRAEAANPDACNLAVLDPSASDA